MIITRTPFRLPLGGGGTDLPAYYRQYGGFLITAAIDKYMYININQPALVHKIKVNYSKTEIVDRPEELKHELVRESLKLLGVGAPIEIHSMADLSGGTGLGSSSTYTVGLLNGLTRLMRHFSSVQELAELACKVEIDLVGKPIGKQDQYAAAFGGIIALEIATDGKVEVTPLELHNEIVRDFENHLMMFYTKIERDANEILADQSDRIKGKESEALSVKSGKESKELSVKSGKESKELSVKSGKEREALSVKREGTKKGEGETEAVRAMHRIKEIGRKSRTALESGDYFKFGQLLHEHWTIKKTISDKMTNPQIDRWYDAAMNSGALGGKIIGAGGGGFFLFCADRGKRKNLRITMESMGLRYMDFRFDFEGSKVIANV